MADLQLGPRLRFAVQTRTADISDGLAARLADPLWLLARQWQFGEFRGDDAGSPVSLQFAASAHAPTWWRPEPDASQSDAQPWQSWTVRAGPLETRIDAEPDDGTQRVRLRVEGGVAARRALLAAGLPTAAQRLPTLAGWDRSIPQAIPISAFDTLLAACTADAAVLDGVIEQWGDPTAPLPSGVLTDWAVPADSAADFAATMRSWQQWWRRQDPGQPAASPAGRVDPPSWDPARLEYRGSLGFASNPAVQLHVDRHPGGPLDWYSVDVIPADPADTASAPAAPSDLQSANPVTAVSVPQPARFAGMPAARFWEFEDARVDFGSTDATAADLARLLLIDYTTVYDHNWYLAPLWLPAGALVHVDQPVTVRDSFGQTWPLEPFAEKPENNTRMFALSSPANPAAGVIIHPSTAPDPHWDTRWFWFAPRLPFSLDSDPIEQVGLRRDEMADLAWAIVTGHTDDFGRTVTDRPVMPDTVAAGPIPAYQVESPVPLNWIPLVPTPLGTGGAYMLVLNPLERGSSGAAAPTLGRLLAPGSPWQIHEEELGDAGLTLTRSRTVARWYDGTPYSWTSRSVWPGGGEADSGLTWDYLR